MNPKNKRTLFLTSTICIILSIVAFALSHMGGASNENYILLYVIAVLLNIVLNLALNIKIASTNGAKALVSLGKWIICNEAYCYQHRFVCVDAGSLSRFL